MPDGSPTCFTITDLKQYTYCPRIFYYQVCLPDIRPVTHKMQAGIDAHERERDRAARRSLKPYNALGGERQFDIKLHSAALRLSGQIDEVIFADEAIIPVDYKLAKHAGYHFKVQLAAYALLLEEAHRRRVERGFLYLIPNKKAEEVRITPKLRRAVKQGLLAMAAITDQERIPPPTDWRQRCPDCEFRRFCNDV